MFYFSQTAAHEIPETAIKAEPGTITLCIDQSLCSGQMSVLISM